MIEMIKIEILGTGCPKCKKTFENAKKALEESKIDAKIVKVENISEIIEKGVFMTPATLVEGNIIKQGDVATKNEIMVAIQKLKK